jgi:sigma-B regulation protein RsbU (phosphoserine phosphatase)
MSEPGSLLIVDDNDASREALARYFRQHGYDVTVGRDGHHALELVRGGRFDAILLDVVMPGVDGFAVLRAVRQNHPAVELPVIMATADGHSEAIVRALELGANDYVTKPYDLSVLLARVQTQLALKGAAEQREELERRLARRNEELEAANRRLAAANQRMKRDLEAAARVQEALLPQALPDTPGARFAWAFKPCEELAGDTLNVFTLGPEHVGLYLLDVSGHGVAASLLSVTLSHVLSPASAPSAVLTRGGPGAPQPRPVPPAEVAARLHRHFPWDPATGQFFTILYGVLNVRTGDFRYASAGHPGPVWLPRGGTPTVLDAAGFPIGVGEPDYRERQIVLGSGDRLYVYSDGVTEAQSGDGGQFGPERLVEVLARCAGGPLEDGLTALLQEVQHWSGGVRLRDDFSALAVEFTGAE